MMHIQYYTILYYHVYTINIYLSRALYCILWYCILCMYYVRPFCFLEYSIAQCMYTYITLIAHYIPHIYLLYTAYMDTGHAMLSRFSEALRKLDPTFDNRNFGYSTFRKFCDALRPDYVTLSGK